MKGGCFEGIGERLRWMLVQSEPNVLHNDLRKLADRADVGDRERKIKYDARS